MLTLRQMDNIVQNDLNIIKGCDYDRDEQGGTIIYTVSITTDSGKLLLGKYRVWEWHDGSSRSGWIHLQDNTNPEITKHRDFIWNLISTDAGRAEDESPVLNNDGSPTDDYLRKIRNIAISQCSTVMPQPGSFIIKG